MPKHKLDDVSLAVFGDEDAGFGLSYEDDDDSADDYEIDEEIDGLEREWLEILSGRVR